MANVTTYNDYMDLANQEYNLTLEGATKDNLFTKISERGQRSKLARYFYNKTGFEISDLNHIVIAPKYGYMIQRLSYINNDLIGGVKSGIQSLNIDTSSEGKIVLRNKGAVGQIKLAYVFHSLAYALGIKIDTSKVDIYPVLNEALHDFEFLYFAPLNIARTITSENIDFINVVFITYNNRTYFDKVLLQSLANAMFNAGWFTKNIVSNISDYVVGTNYSYNDNTNLLTYETVREAVETVVSNISSSSTILTPIKNSIRNSITEITNHLYNNLATELKNSNFPFFIESGYFNNTREFYVKLTVAYNSDINKRYIRIVSKPVASMPDADLARITLNNSDNINNYSRYDVYYNNNGEITSNTSEQGNYANYSGYIGYYYDGANNVFYSNVGILTQSVEGITIIDGAKLPSGTDSLESDYPLWVQKLEKWTVTAIERLIEQEGEALRNLFLINDFLPLNIITGGITYPEKKPGVPYDPIEVETYEVLLPEIIPPLPTNVVETLTLIPDEDDIVEDPKDPKTYEPIIDPKHPENYPPNNYYYDVEINYPKDYNDPIGDNPSNPTEPPSKNHGNISIPPKNPTDSVTSSKLFTVYNPTADQIDALGGYLWGESIAGTLASIFTNPLNAIISLHCIYCEPDVIGTKEIRLGYLASGVSAKYVVSQYKEVDCGTIRIPEYYGDCRDYSPYTTISLFLPFIGFRPIKVDDVMGSELSIKYFVDVYTGTCLACVSVNKGGVIQLTYNFDGNCSVMLPLTSGSWANMTVGLATALTSMIVNPVAGALQIPNAVHNGISMSSQGQLGCNAGAMGRKKPYVVVTNTQAYDAVGYNELYGYPANILTKLSQLEGYTKVKEVHVENVNNATVDEKNEIERLLKSGVIIS